MNTTTHMFMSTLISGDDAAKAVHEYRIGCLLDLHLDAATTSTGQAHARLRKLQEAIDTIVRAAYTRDSIAGRGVLTQDLMHVQLTTNGADNKQAVCVLAALAGLDRVTERLIYDLLDTSLVPHH